MINNRKQGMLVAMTAALVFTINCVKQPINLMDEGKVSVEKITQDGFYISRVSVYQENDGLVVSGSLRSNRHNYTLGHMDIALMGPDNSLIHKGSTSLIRKNHRNRHMIEYAFSFHLPYGEDDVSVVRLALHEPVFPKTYDCGENQAVTTYGLVEK
ncbi:MAG: hypothetical protein JRJ79_06230 [Deltaproteobacteria bacterium]|nr:hypothetical protein [Deltaproteobacteria bacterium]